MTFIYWLVKRYKQRRSRLAATSQQVELKALAATSEFHAALQRAVEQLPTRTHAAIAEEDVSTVPSTDVECVVCMEPYEEGELLKDLPCGHTFHAACIDAWLLGKGRPAPTGPLKLPGLPTCPLCKAVPVEVPEPTLPEKGKPTRQSV